MLQPEWKLADPICTFVFSVLVLFTTFAILRDIFAILMEGNWLITCYCCTVQLQLFRFVTGLFFQSTPKLGHIANGGICGAELFTGWMSFL